MGFDSRHLVLEFLAENRTLGINQMTLVFFGKKCDDFLEECLKTSFRDKIYVYHSKGTRLFWKEYGFENLSGSIIELLLDSMSAMNLTKNEITFSITEPFYGLDLRKFDFDYLSIIPVKETEELIGYALLYSFKKIEEDKYPHISLRRLFRNIVKNENQAKIKEFDNLLENKIGYLNFENKLFLSKNLSEILGIPQKVDNPMSVKETLLSLNYLEINNTKYGNYELCEFEKQNNVLLAANELDKPKISDSFTLLYFHKDNLKDDIMSLFGLILESVKMVFPKKRGCYFKTSDSSIVGLFDEKCLKKDINKLKSKLKDLLIIDLRGGIEIPKKASLFQVVKYLDETKVTNFNFEEYQKYRLTTSYNSYYD